LTVRTLIVYIDYMERIEDFMTVEETAKRMRFKESTVKTWVRNKDIVSYKVGGQIRILEKDVVEWIKSGKA